ncbi:MAG: hypothetical protein JWL95_1383 [Gemmatimonadetes bacterium]|nr:hypothetical protein [Gemmatimonadota bacterium]
MTRAPVALSWSGGKDSSLALYRLRASTEYEVTVLLTSVTREYDRVSIHGVRRSLLERQAASLGLPLIEVALEPHSTNAAYQKAFLAALGELAVTYPAVRQIAFGDLYLRDVRAYRDRLLGDTGYHGLYPLWERPTREMAELFIADGFAATLVCVDNSQIDASFAGRRFDRALLDALPPTADPCGENGEFHTFVHDGPIFAEPIAVSRGQIVLREGRFTYCDLLLAEREEPSVTPAPSGARE